MLGPFAVIDRTTPGAVAGRLFTVIMSPLAACMKNSHASGWVADTFQSAHTDAFGRTVRAGSTRCGRSRRR